MSALAITDPVLHEFADQVSSSGEVAVKGAMTRWWVGGTLDSGCRVVSAPTGLVQYEPAEMTVKVRAGMSVAELHAELAREGQRTALPERGGTVGGAVAVGENGPHVGGRGRIRDAVLQVRYVAADGELVTGGGPTVKNVSGFNLPKLLVGSLGTIGLIAELVLRTNPIPACRRWLRGVELDPWAARDVLLRPSSILWDGTTTWVELEGHEADVDHQARALGALGAIEECADGPDLPRHRWSLTPGELSHVNARHEAFVAEIVTGILHSANSCPTPPMEPGLAQLAARVKHEFDPTGRFNPGRLAGGRA